MKLSRKLLMGVSGVALSFTATTTVIAQDNEVIEEVVTIGSRSTKPRSATDSPVPVDVISGEDFNSTGNSADITDNLKMLVPSFTASPATGDGSAFVRPTSLRGMAPDQTLVLINGKRRHRSSLVQFFAPAAGNGSHGVDIGMIPGVALKRVEVLRDGAAAQYGSDAIAGVMNFVLRDASEGGEVSVNYGQFYEGEESMNISANVGLPLGDNGFFNMSVDYKDNDALSRGVQRTATIQPFVDAGVTGFGADSPFGDAPLVQTWGRPETSGTRFFVNSGVELDGGGQVYVRGNYAETDGRYRFFYRTPDHSTLTVHRENGFTGLAAGYTPFLDGAQVDYSLIGGVDGETDGGFFYDFSASLGVNQLDYFLNNTVNPSIPLVGGEIPQMDFIMGGYEQKEINLNADFSKSMGDNMNVAFGAEWREETFTTISGEPNAYLGAGPSGMSSVKPADEGAFSRSNFGGYIDIEHDISDEFMLQYAARYEDFSDFGGTFNGKVAARYSVSDSTNLRAAVSTGFHAPTPGQANITSIITTFDGATGLQVEEGLVKPTSPEALAAGGAALKEETSVSYSAGFSTDLSDNTTITADMYQTDVSDRIYRTGDLPVVGGADNQTVSFYTNVLDVRHKGLDIVVTSDVEWSSDTNTDVSFAFNYMEVEVTNVQLINGLTPVSASTIEDIENNYPNTRFVLTTNTHFGDKFNFMARANYYGSHYDERGTIGAASSPSAKIDAIIYIDLELGYQVTDSLRFVVGGANVLDTYVGAIGAPYANRLSVGLPYPRRTVANYEGGSWYLKAKYTF